MSAISLNLTSLQPGLGLLLHPVRFPAVSSLCPLLRPSDGLPETGQGCLFRGVALQLCCFPWAVVTNNHTPRGLKQQKLILSQFWRPEVSNQGLSTATLPQKALPAPGGPRIPRPVGSIARILPLSSGLLLSASLCLLSLPRVLSLDLGPILMLYDLISRSSPKLHLQRPYFQIKSYSKVPSRHEFCGGGHYLTSTPGDLIDPHSLPSSTREDHLVVTV